MHDPAQFPYAGNTLLRFHSATSRTLSNQAQGTNSIDPRFARGFDLLSWGGPW